MIEFSFVKQMGKQLGWYQNNYAIFGLYKGYFFTVSKLNWLRDEQRRVSATLNYLDSTQEEQIKTILESHKKKIGYDKFTVEYGTVKVSFGKWRFKGAKAIYQLLDLLVTLFQKMDLAKTEKCPDCQNNQVTNYYSLGHTGAILCQTCFNEYEQGNLREKTVEKSHWVGLIGTFVFSLLGIVSWVILEVYLNVVSVLAALLILHLSEKGYTYAKGKTDHLKKYIIIGVSMFSILLASIITHIVLLLQQGVIFEQAIELLFSEPILLSHMLGRALFGYFLLLFFGFAIWLPLIDGEEEVGLARRIK
ncbi:MAG: hypothetical protein ACFB0B_20545 [Thermonemataceae bacterium]